MPDNPILDPSFHVRWSALTADVVEPGMDAALDRAERALRAVEEGAGPPTFEGTFQALDDAIDSLNQAWGRVTHLQSVCDSPELRLAHNRVLPKVSAFLARVPLRPALWGRLRAFAGSAPAGSLPAVRARYVAETVAEFREAGADLPEQGRARLEALQSELAQLTQRYAENVLDATNAWQLIVEDEGRLEGLPGHAKARARADAEAKGLGSADRPAWRFTLHMPSQEPFMSYVRDEGLRRDMWRASSEVGACGPHDNAALVSRILLLRAEKAALLGKRHFPDLVLARRMARSGERALAFVEDMRRRCAGPFGRECAELERFRAGIRGGAPGRPAPWDVVFLAERMRKASYDFDPEELRPYFPMDRVLAGLFEICLRVFGISVAERPRGEVETWHPEVRFYDVFDSGGDGD